MLKTILVTIVFMYGGGDIKMTTYVETIEDCQEMIQSVKSTVGEENVSVATCEPVLRVTQ